MSSTKKNDERIYWDEEKKQINKESRGTVEKKRGSKKYKDLLMFIVKCCERGGRGVLKNE